jgi:uncharacterized protein YndB with AHSA1/START domain
VEVRQEFDVRVPADAAFAFFADPNHAFERLAPQLRARWDGSLGPGTTFRLEAPNPRDNCDGVVDDLDPPRRLSYRLWRRSDPDSAGTVTMEFEPTADGTHVVGVITTRMNGAALGVASRLLQPLLAIQARRGKAALIREVERYYSTGQRRA